MTTDSAPPKPVRRHRWLPWLILVVAFAIAAGLVATKPKSQPVVASERAWLVDTQLAVAGSYRPSVTLYGRIESLWSSQLTAGVAADVVEVSVIDGDQVGVGDLLVRLDDRDARLVLAQREAELRQAQSHIDTELRRHQNNIESLPREQRLLTLTRSEVNRLQDLVEKQVGAQSALDEARQAAERQAIAVSARQQAVDEHAARLAEVEAALARAKALRDQAVLDVERCEIRAPFDGRIVAVEVAPGRRVRIGDPLVRMFDANAMVVRAQIPSRVVPLVLDARSRGAELTVRGALDGVEITARLRNLAGEATGGTGGVDGIFDVIGDTGPISQGRFLRLELTLPAADGLISLPHEAVYGADRVYVVDADSRMRGVAVRRVGEWFDKEGQARILVNADGVPDGARIVTTQLPNALDGLLVKVAGGG